MLSPGVCRSLRSKSVHPTVYSSLEKYLLLEARIIFYDYYLKPLIEYCSSGWGICSKEKQTEIIKIQKKAARLILEAPLLTPSKHIFLQRKI